MEPCKQEANIGGLQATVHSNNESLRRLLDGQDHLINTLERIAQQGEAIHALKKNQDELFKRVRQVELDATAERVKIAGIVGLVSIIVSAVTAAIARHLWR